MNWKQRIGTALGNALEYYDIAVMGAISGYLSLYFERHGITHATETVWGIFALRFLIRPLGGLVIGYYADIAGRKAALMLTSLLTGLASVLLAFMPEGLSGKWIMILFFSVQMAQAFAFGGEYPALISLLLSDASKKQHARISSLIVGSSLVGVIASSLIVMILGAVKNEEWMISTGWRIPVFLGIANIAISFWFRWHLPVMPKSDTAGGSHTKTLRTAFLIFLCTIPGAVIFYVLNIAGGITGKALHLGHFASVWPVLTSSMLLLSIVVSGFLVDRKFSPRTAYRLSIIALFLSGIPLYVMMGTENSVAIAIAQVAILVIAGLLLSCLAAVLWELSEGQNVALGIGYNVSLSIFGGLTPLILVNLTPYGMAAAGTYIALSALPALYPLLRHKHTARAADISSSRH